MRILHSSRLIVLSLATLSGLPALAAPCDNPCREQYVQQFATILSKTKPSMADYFSLFSEPEGPEGLRLYLAKKKTMAHGSDPDHMQEIALASDAFDEVSARNSSAPSPYLACLHRHYSGQLPKHNSEPTTNSITSTKLTTVTLGSGHSTWKFIYSDKESRPDSIIAPDGITLGDMAKDACVLRK